MAYTAIVLTPESQATLRRNAIAWGWGMDKMLCHHCTLAMGDQSARFKVGEERVLSISAVGRVDGRVTAFRVSSGATDSKNAVPHITIACAKDARPVESNDIKSWTAIKPFEVIGKIQIC